eukprot:CFRG0324T1
MSIMPSAAYDMAKVAAQSQDKPMLHYEMLQKKNEKLEADLQGLDEKEAQERWKMNEERKVHEARIQKERRQLEEEIKEYEKYHKDLQAAINAVESGNMAITGGY